MTDENDTTGVTETTGAAGVTETSNGISPDVRSTLRERGAAGGGGPFDLNAQQKRVLIAVLIVHFVLTRFTLRDLRHRPEAAVRGPKRLWRVWATVNTTGSLAYWLVGRRRGTAVPPA